MSIPQKGNTFPITRPVLVKPLLPDEQKVLLRHGAIAQPYPEIAIQRPDLLKGHMITFPVGTHMQEDDLSRIQYTLLFPDGYTPMLIWSERSYHFYPEGFWISCKVTR
jgi:hypothetical protein